MPVGTRVRGNNAQGTTTDNPLAIGATTINSAGLANLPTVTAGNHAVLVLDPLRGAGAPEIVIVTAHTAAATSATITRGAYGTTARAHNSGTLWIHGATIDDVVQILTSGTRPSDPYEGQLIYETDTDREMVYTGSLWRLSHNPPTVHVYHNATQSLTNAVGVTLAFNSERYDPTGMHDPVTLNSRLTIAMPGVYIVTASVEFENVGAVYADRIVQLWLNTTTEIGIDRTMDNASGWIGNPTTQVKCAAGDFLTATAYQVSAATRLVQASNSTTQQRNCEFSAAWIGPA